MKLIFISIGLFLSTISWTQDGFEEPEEVIEDVTPEPVFIGIVRETYPIYLGCEDFKSRKLQQECTQLAIINFFSRNTSYPAETKDNGFEGTVWVDFTVNKDGEVTKVEIFKGIHESLDMEVIRVTKLLPKFIPGTQRGFPIAVTLTIPVHFKLQ